MLPACRSVTLFRLLVQRGALNRASSGVPPNNPKRRPTTGVSTVSVRVDPSRVSTIDRCVVPSRVSTIARHVDRSACRPVPGVDHCLACRLLSVRRPLSRRRASVVRHRVCRPDKLSAGPTRRVVPQSRMSTVARRVDRAPTRRRPTGAQTAAQVPTVVPGTRGCPRGVY